MTRNTRWTITAFLLATASVAALRLGDVEVGPPSVIVTHWSNGHLMRHGTLLPRMADSFNAAGYRIRDGRRIKVQVQYYGSGKQAKDLLSRASRGTALDSERTDPTIVTPSAAHWLLPVNRSAGRKIIDPAAAESIARAFIGIVTYREMAECLGWPETPIGYGDLIALRSDPRGWSKLPCAKASWGRKPLFGYTDPTTSSTGRSVLFSLYAMAAGKSPEALEEADVHRPEVVELIKRFQTLVDHYMISSRHLSTKLYQGPRFGHFFVMPEDNLTHLYEGTERIYVDGKKVQPPALEADMVFIMPREGTMVRNNCACIVSADWVSEAQREAANVWIEFLQEPEQQRAFNLAGFRPATGQYVDPLRHRRQASRTTPVQIFDPAKLDPEVAAAIDASWADVKRPGIVTFVIDSSGSMSGSKLSDAQDGLARALDGMPGSTRVGLIGFDSEVRVLAHVDTLSNNRFGIVEAARELHASGGTALYEAIDAAITLTEEADGSEDAIRAVVVLTDGRATLSHIRLTDIIRVSTRNEVPVPLWEGNDGQVVASDGRPLSASQLVGTGPARTPDYEVQIFYIGIGADADLQIGRLLAEATGAEFQGAKEEDLAGVLEAFGKYF